MKKWQVQGLVRAYLSYYQLEAYRYVKTRLTVIKVFSSTKISTFLLKWPTKLNRQMTSQASLKKKLKQLYRSG